MVLHLNLSFSRFFSKMWEHNKSLSDRRNRPEFNQFPFIFFSKKNFFFCIYLNVLGKVYETVWLTSVFYLSNRLHMNNVRETMTKVEKVFFSWTWILHFGIVFIHRFPMRNEKKNTKLFKIRHSKLSSLFKRNCLQKEMKNFFPDPELKSSANSSFSSSFRLDCLINWKIIIQFISLNVH